MPSDWIGRLIFSRNFFSVRMVDRLVVCFPDQSQWSESILWILRLPRMIPHVHMVSFNWTKKFDDQVLPRKGKICWAICPSHENHQSRGLSWFLLVPNYPWTIEVKQLSQGCKQTCQWRESNLWPLDYESKTLTTRPRCPSIMQRNINERIIIIIFHR